MGLSDVAGLLTNDPKTQKKIVNLLVILGRKEMTFQQLINETDFNERYLRFLITKLRSVRLLMGERSQEEYVYYLSYEGFSTYLKTKYSDAIYNLVKRR
jgi:hypothetical protein